ncbi:MAG: DUF4296 domain-containing protein [Flavobacteriales bacterium]|nr:DUF4296 domain-containing protein [Flavobacteriales bacterium]
MRSLRFLLFLTLLGCASGPVPPEGALERERFKNVLLEAQLIEARTNHELIVEHQGQVPTEGYYDELFREQGTTREQFTLTFDWYADHPALLKEVYEEIITELGRRKDAGAQ